MRLVHDLLEARVGRAFELGQHRFGEIGFGQIAHGDVSSGMIVLRRNRCHTRSMITAMPCPTPMHIVHRRSARRVLRS